MVEVQYGLRLDGEEKKAFEELCRRNSISMAQAIKDFIHRANQAGELDVTETTIAPSPDALAEIRDRLVDLEDLVRKEGDRLSALENRWEIDTGDRLAKLEDSLSTLKKAVTALETGDRPTLPKREIPQGLTHKELAAAMGSSERTMQRIAKEKERWPEGYHWSEESKKWFSMEG